MRKTFFVLSILLLLVTLAACGTPTSTTTATTAQPTTAAGPKYGGVMSLNHNGGTAVISAPADTSQLMMRTALPVFEPLFICDSNEKIQPWLADSYEISPDNKTITIKLKKGIKFTDGTAFNADAVKFNLQLDLKNNVQSSQVLRKIVSYDIVDDYTMRLNLSSFDVTLLLTLAQTPIAYMASPTAQQKPTTPDNITEVHMVGTGPFMLESWKRDTFVKFKKNPNYWQPGQPYLDGLVWNNVTDLTVSLMSFKSGQVNGVLTLDPADALSLKKEGYNVYIPPLKMIHNMRPDSANPDSPFAKQQVREALEYALDKKAMADGVGMGFFEPAYQFAASTNAWFDPSLPQRTYDPAKARQLLKDAGYPDGVKTTLSTDPRVRKDTLTAIQSYLKAAGFDCTLDMADMGRATDMMVKGWKGILLQGFPAPSSFNIVNAMLNTPMFPSMLRPAGWQQKWDTMLAEPNDKIRVQQMKDMVKLLNDTNIIIPYQIDSSRVVTDKTVRNFTEYFQQGFIADYYRPGVLWLDK